VTADLIGQAKATGTPMRTDELLARLRRHYIKPSDPLPGGVFIPECGWNGSTGGRVDALYVGFTSTSGRILVGHELKVSRADWRHELDQNGKADAWHDQCHAWYVVAPSTEIVPPDELPDGWGLLVVDARTTTRLKCVVKATRRTVTPSWNATRSIIARQDTLRAQAIAAHQQKADQEARAEVSRQIAAERVRRDQRSMSPEDREAINRWDEVCDLVRAAGYEPADWGPKHIAVDELAAAIRIVKAAGSVPPFRVSGLEQSLRDAADQVAEVTAAVAEYRRIDRRNPPTPPGSTPAIGKGRRRTLGENP
jgi:hypothetical protein